MLTVPTEKRELVDFTSKLIEQCRVSVGNRLAYYRLMNAIAETGRYDGNKSLLNMLYKHLDRTAAHLFSPVELKFTIGFDRAYPKLYYERASVVARQVTRQWSGTNTDFLFGNGVFESLKYGACFFKQWVQVEGPKQKPYYYAKLVMPWQFGVYNEAETDLSRQIALCETTTMTLPEAWRRISHLPNARQLFMRVKGSSSSSPGYADPQSYFHQVLSVSQLQTGVDGGGLTRPGGIVQLASDPNYAIMGPTIAAETVQVHELWVQDDEDYTTILMIEPDIVIAPIYKKSNLLGVSQEQPYRLIQPNQVTNWIWGRSELVDLIEPQGMLSRLCDDMQRLIGLQIDKLIAFIGEGGITDEIYGQFRSSGYLNMNQGSTATDLTPKFPTELLPIIKFMIEEIDQLSGFPPIMRGQGESGVRAGVHGDTLMKTASPTLRDRSLLVERQLADAAQLTLDIKEAKEGTKYWTKADSLKDIEETQFLLSDLPEDRRVEVDSHSSSPIFSNENTQLVTYAQKTGVVDGEYFIDNVSLPNKDEAKVKYREKQKQQQEMFQKIMQERPEVADKVLQRQFSGGGRR